MPKTKLFAKGDKKKGKAPKAQPSTADEYLEAGVDFEEAGEKWRGGDAAKSTRFFVRAIDCYQEALSKFPNSFDLAYNKARVQYELTQYPKLLAQLPGTLIELLETALTSSRYALQLKQDNTEVLYTTAQVLSSLAEASTANTQSSHQPLPLFEESLTLFQRCLAIQEANFMQSQIPPPPPQIAENNNEDADLEDGSASLSSTPPSNAIQEEQWASLIEPITAETILDTIIAQLEVLTLICPLVIDPSLLTFVDQYSSPLLTTKLPQLNAQVPLEAALTALITSATFISTFSDANFLHTLISTQTYLETLQKAWSFDFSQSPEGLVAAAEALVAFNSSHRNSTDSTTSSPARWKALSTAQTYLTSATKLPNVSELAKIHLLRGDIDLWRYQLGNEGHEIAVKSQSVLVGNAGKFYRGAKALGGEKSVTDEAAIKEGVAKWLGGDKEGLFEIIKIMGEIVVKEALVEYWQEGLISGEEMESISRI